MQPAPPPFASHALPPTPPPLAAHMSRGPSAASLAGGGGPPPVPDDWSESVQDAPSDAEDASADGEQYTAWSVRGGQVEQYTRDLTRVRRSASVAKPGQARVSGRELEEDEEEELPYAQVEDEDEDERGYDSERDAAGSDQGQDPAAAAAWRRPSVMSLRHQLATTVSSDAPLPLPVHVAEMTEHEQPQQNGEEIEQGRRVAQLDLRELSLREKEDDNAQPRQVCRDSFRGLLSRTTSTEERRAPGRLACLVGRLHRRGRRPAQRRQVDRNPARAQAPARRADSTARRRGREPRDDEHDVVHDQRAEADNRGARDRYAHAQVQRGGRGLAGRSPAVRGGHAMVRSASC